MAQGLTLEQLQQMGAKPAQTGGLTLQEIQSQQNQGMPAQSEKSLSQKILDIGTGVTNFLGGKAVADTFGAEIAKAKAKTPEEKNLITQPTLKETAGSALQLGANFIPGVGAEAGLATKIAIGAGTGYAFDVGSKLQNNESKPLVPGVGTAVAGALPVVGAVTKPATAIVGRLLKGLGSGLSGVSAGTIDKIVSNPEFAQQASKKLEQAGNSKILEENAKTIINGVSKIRQEARQSFGQGLEKLSTEDIKPSIFKDKVQPILDKYGVGTEVKNFGNMQGKTTLSNIEFSDPKNIEKAVNLLHKLDTVPLDGKSLRSLANNIENSAYKVTGNDVERLSFNAFIKDLSSSLTDSISASTDKLGEINSKFSQDMQLTEAVQNIFGKVNYKNLPEVVKASQKLEGLFAQKGLAPDVVDSFLKRIGVNPVEFTTSEAVRQISNKSTGANTKGLSVGELVQQATSAVVTPEMVKQLSIKAGMANEKLLPFLQSLKTPARNLVIQALLKSR